MLTVEAIGQALTTIEGLKESPVQRAFVGAVGLSVRPPREQDLILPLCTMPTKEGVFTPKEEFCVLVRMIAAETQSKGSGGVAVCAMVGVGIPVGRTVIVQPDRLCREGLIRILGEMEGVVLLPSAASAREALQIAEEHMPDLVLTEVDMPEDDGLALLSRLAELPVKPQVVVLSRQIGHAYVTAAMARGAKGYLLRTSSPDELKESLQRVMNGQTYVQASLAASLIGRRLGPERKNELTERECLVLIHLAKGATNQAIADVLYLGEKTVRNTLTRLFHKLDARNRTEAVSIGRDAGYL